MSGRHQTPSTLVGQLRAIADMLATIDERQVLAPMFVMIHINAPADSLVADQDRMATVDAYAAALGQTEFVAFDESVRAYRNNEIGRTLLPGTSLQICAHAVEDPAITEMLAAYASQTDVELHPATDGGGIA